MRRARRRRCIGFQPNFIYFEPRDRAYTCGEEVLKLEELESIRLKDFLQLDQASAAAQMGISQPTFHRIITEAHRKVARALIEGKAIRIEGGHYVMVDRTCWQGYKKGPMGVVDRR